MLHVRHALHDSQYDWLKRKKNRATRAYNPYCDWLQISCFITYRIRRNLEDQDDFVLEQLILVSYVQLRADYFTKTGNLSLQRTLSF